MDMKLEVVVVPVTDVDRAKRFYLSMGWRLDADFAKGDWRIVQVTPPGSACSICIGVGFIDMAPGSLGNLQLVVTDIEEARAELAGRGMEVSGVDVQPWGSFVYFKDPDGNAWSVQQLPPWD